MLGSKIYEMLGFREDLNQVRQRERKLQEELSRMENNIDIQDDQDSLNSQEEQKGESRLVHVEAARIARGPVLNVTEINVDDFLTKTDKNSHKKLTITRFNTVAVKKETTAIKLFTLK